LKVAVNLRPELTHPSLNSIDELYGSREIAVITKNPMEFLQCTGRKQFFGLRRPVTKGRGRRAMPPLEKFSSPWKNLLDIV